MVCTVIGSPFSFSMVMAACNRESVAWRCWVAYARSPARRCSLYLGWFGGGGFCIDREISFLGKGTVERHILPICFRLLIEPHEIDQISQVPGLSFGLERISDASCCS